RMTVTIASVTFDCADALVVARFWSAAIDRPIDAGATSGFASIGFADRRTTEGWVAVERRDEPTWIFAQVPESKAAKNPVHLDVVAPDLEAEIARLVELGATRVSDRDEYGYTWTLMTDPEGNEFDIGKAV